MFLQVELSGNGVLTITISRPEALNALNQSVIGALSDAFSDVETKKEIKGVILTGAGDRSFVAGADIKEFTGLSEERAYALSKTGQELFQRIEQCSKPVIAAINGFALGGGCELAMACHLRLATANAKFGQPEINLGLIPGYGGTQRLTRLVGRTKALELLLTADMISADEAQKLGLVNHVFNTREEMIAAAQTLLEKIISKSPISIGKIIHCVNAGFDSPAKGFEEEAQAFANCVTTEDFKEGTSAFLEKRRPVFKGI